MHAGTIELDDGAARRDAARPAAREAEQLYEAYAARIRGYVAFRVREPADVDDLTADVFRRAVAGPVPADRGAWPAWLFRVAHNAVVDHYRRRRFPDPLGLLRDRPDDAPALEDAAIRGEEIRAADLALRALPERVASGGYTVDAIDPLTGRARPMPGATLPGGEYRPDLVGVRGDYALLTLAWNGEETPAREALMVELATGRVAVGLPPEAAGTEASFTFAGWLGRRRLSSFVRRSRSTPGLGRRASNDQPRLPFAAPAARAEPGGM